MFVLQVCMAGGNNPVRNFEYSSREVAEKMLSVITNSDEPHAMLMLESDSYKMAVKRCDILYALIVDFAAEVRIGMRQHVLKSRVEEYEAERIQVESAANDAVKTRLMLPERH